LANREQSASAKLRNAFGGAEDLEGSVSFGMKTQHTYRVSLSAPLTGDMATRGELSTYAVDNDYTPWASCKEAQKGIKAAVFVSCSRNKIPSETECDADNKSVRQA
jgi:outer membrane protein insertion porin family